MNTVQNNTDTRVGIYVGTYEKYNGGSIAGDWLYFDDYSDFEDLKNAIIELHQDEKDPEYMIQDTDNDYLKMIDESMNFDELEKAFDTYTEIENDSLDTDAIKAYVSIFGKFDKSDFEDRYQGEFDSVEAYAEDYAEQTGMLEGIPDNIQRYFDFEAFGRDMELGGDITECNGYIFLNR